MMLYILHVKKNRLRDLGEMSKGGAELLEFKHVLETESVF